MCIPTLFSACGDFIGKLNCQNRCNWRCCTRDRITVTINGNVDERTQAIAGAAIDGGPPPEPMKNDEEGGGIPPFLAKLFKKKESKPPISSGRAEGGPAAAGQGDGSFLSAVPIAPFAIARGVGGSEASAGAASVTYSEEQLTLIDQLSSYRIVTNATQRGQLFSLGVLRLNTILLKKGISLEQADVVKSRMRELQKEIKNMQRLDSAIFHLVSILKKEKRPDILINDYSFTQDMIDKIKMEEPFKIDQMQGFFNQAHFWDDLEQNTVLANCSTETVLRLMDIADDRIWLQDRTVKNTIKNKGYDLSSWLGAM